MIQVVVVEGIGIGIEKREFMVGHPVISKLRFGASCS